MANRLLALLAHLALLISAHPASSAVITTYSSRASWEAAVGTFATEDFETATQSVSDCGPIVLNGCSLEVTFDVGQLTIVIDAGIHSPPPLGIVSPGLNGTSVFRGDIHAPGSIVSQPLLWNRIEFPSPVTAAALDTSLELTFTVLGQAFVAGGFLGVTSDEPFSAITVSAPPPGTGFINAWVDYDNISFAPIPEPSTGLLVMTGLLGLARWPRRWRRLHAAQAMTARIRPRPAGTRS